MIYSKKSLGQNFLKDLNIIKKIVDLVKVYNRDILEIGPGKGALTDEIIRNKPRSLVLVEKDYALFKELKLKYRKNKKVTIFNEDILKFNFKKKIKNNSIIFGNLPYNISSQILATIIKIKDPPYKYSDLIFMFQKELAQRIIGKYNTSKYGRLSILTNYKLNIIKKFDVSSNCFDPKPKVESVILSFKPKKSYPFRIKNLENLEKITNILFSNKRKMINKNIKKLFNHDQVDTIKNLNLESRPSNLNPEKYFEITMLYEKYL